MNSGFQITDLTPSNASRAVDVICAAFESDSTYSWARVLNRPPEDLRGYLTDCHMKDVLSHQPASIVAVDGNSVLGVLTMEPFHQTPDADPSELPSEHAIVGIMQAGENAYLSACKEKGVEGPEKRTCYIAFLATDPAAQRRGIGRALITEGLERITEDGRYDTVMALCTSPKSVAGFAAHGFEDWGGVGYGEFVIGGDGWRPFVELPDGMRAMVLRL